MKIVIASNSRVNHHIWSAGSMMIYSGIFLLISALIYLIVNLYRADSSIKIWLPLMMVGVVQVSSGLLMKWQNPKLKGD